MDPKELMTANKVVGTKETLRMVEKHLCKIVFIANDASMEIVRPLIAACEKNGIPVEFVESMRDLGESCGIKVAAASAGLL